MEVGMPSTCAVYSTALPAAFSRTISTCWNVESLNPAAYARPLESAARTGSHPSDRMKPTGAFHATPVPLEFSLATKMEVSHVRLTGTTTPPPLGSTAIELTANPSWFCHRMVFPSADSFVTEEGGVPVEIGKADRM